jgi:hypothetical protein
MRLKICPAWWELAIYSSLHPLPPPHAIMGRDNYLYPILQLYFLSGITSIARDILRKLRSIRTYTVQYEFMLCVFVYAFCDRCVWLARGSVQGHTETPDVSPGNHCKQT